MKKCTACGETKPFTFFFKDKRAPDGHVAKCRSCVAAQRKENNGEAIHTIKIRDVPCDTCDQTAYCWDKGMMCANFSVWLDRGRPNDRPKVPDRHV